MLYKKKFLISFLTLLTLIVVIGSGFAVWNFDTEDDSSKGIYNLGLYVTPNVESLGTVSLNNDYVMVLDQGDLTGIDEKRLGEDVNYYRRGISIRQLRPDATNSGRFEIGEDGTYVRDPVKQLTAVYVAAQEYTQKILTENINDMRFLTKIRLRKKLATYVQVRPNDSYLGTTGEASIFEVQDKEKISLLDDEYVEYLYDWGNLSEVLLIENGEFHTEWKKREVCSISQDETFKNSHCVDGLDPIQDWRNDDSFLTDGDIGELPQKMQTTPSTINRTSNLGLYLVPCRGIKTYTVYDKTAGQIVGFYNNQSDAEEFIANNTSTGEGYQGHDLVVTLAYYKYYKDGETRTTESDLFTNEKEAYPDVKYNDAPSEGSLQIGTVSFDVFDCYTFTYTLNVATYDGKEGNEAAEGPYAYENARFIYYPCEQSVSGRIIPNQFEGENMSKFVLNTLEYAYDGGREENSSFRYRMKPITVALYEEMLRSFETDDSSTGQFVDLEMRYVIVDFTSELITKASDETNSVSPTV